LGENGAWANPGIPQIFEVPPIISGMGKATNVEFDRYIQMFHANKSQLKICEKMERGDTGTAQIIRVPLIISGTDKAMNFKFGGCIHRVHANKSPVKIWENRERGRIQGLPKFLKYPLLSQEWVKLQTSNLTDIFRCSMRTKAS